MLEPVGFVFPCSAILLCIIPHTNSILSGLYIISRSHVRHFTVSSDPIVTAPGSPSGAVSKSMLSLPADYMPKTPVNWVFQGSWRIRWYSGEANRFQIGKWFRAVPDGCKPTLGEKRQAICQTSRIRISRFTLLCYVTRPAYLHFALHIQHPTAGIRTWTSLKTRSKQR
jgi:hypothetical protein